MRRLSSVQTFAVAAFYFAAASAIAADSRSPIDDAHSVFRQLINKGYVGANADKSRHYISYRGYRCHSTLEIAHDVKDIDWEQVTSVTDFSDFAHVHGPVTHTDVNGIKDTDKDIGFWAADKDTAKQLADAGRVLMNSCAPKPKSN